MTGNVASFQKISHTEGGFAGPSIGGGRFGSSVASIGDLDGDGVTDIVVGSRNDDDGGANRGAVYVLFLNRDGTVKNQQKISDTAGNLGGGSGGTLADQDWFGSSVAFLGDLNGDGTTEIVVGAPLDDDGGTNRGAVYVLSLNTNGVVASEQKISEAQGNLSSGLSATLADNDLFGTSVAAIGDVDRDGVTDIAVGAPEDRVSGDGGKAVWILFLNSNGTVKAKQEIGASTGGFTGTLENLDIFGASVGSPGDIDGDNIPDLFVGAPRDDDGGTDRGAVWVLLLNSNGTVKSHQKISNTAGGFGGTLANRTEFGTSLSFPGDIDGDGSPDAIVGASRDDGNGGTRRGAAWVLFLNGDGTIKSQQRIGDGTGGFTGTLDDDDFFGDAITSAGDINGDGTVDLVAGAPGDDDGPGSGRGAVWVLFMEAAQ